ncbi:MAG: hypothetical protein WCG45_03610 [bacterium]
MTNHTKYNQITYSACNVNEECYGCEVLPICMGGCKANNKVGENKKYDAGCITTRYSLEKDIIRLYEKKIDNNQEYVPMMNHTH